jgi:peptide-methionine (S)-S-oxide reductase
MKTESIVLGGGCFWCLDAAYRRIKGVTEVVSGYAGGNLADPSYEAVSGGATGHAEVVKVSFDPGKIKLSDILDVFWAIHNPTTPNQQGNDIGPQYRSMILYNGDVQKLAVEASVQEVQKLWKDPIVTEVAPLVVFYPAEDYHQDYFAKNPSQGYCQIVINPKLLKLTEKFTQLLRS